MRQREISFQLGQVPAETQGCARSWGLCSHICQSRAVGQGEGGCLVGPSQPGHLRDIPSYCLDEYEEEVPSTGSQVEDEESRDGLDPGQFQTDPEEQQQCCKSSQTQHRGLQRERNHGHQPMHIGLGDNEPMGRGCISSPQLPG